jgi:phosphoadenosine phosphosulfate reductase
MADLGVARTAAVETVTGIDSAGFYQLGAVDRLRVLAEQVPGRKVFTTSFGIEDQAITHMIFTEKLPIEVVTIDTGRFFPETYQLWQQTEEKYGRRIRAVYPQADAVAGFVDDWGINGFYHAVEARHACCHVRKVEPLGRALDAAAAWVTGLRADQSGARGAVPPLGWDEARGLWKAAPIADWSREDVVAYCDEHGIPVNALHAQGFPSIGCQPCTRAVQPGEPERAGRWWWEQDDSRECGLHVTADGRLVRAQG